uniref:Uncharacterized protein n=1 Tax=Anguilla anguilla TaxID=7936 RepID=A0A0E9Q7W6_ANGAN
MAKCASLLSETF